MTARLAARLGALVAVLALCATAPAAIAQPAKARAVAPAQAASAISAGRGGERGERGGEHISHGLFDNVELFRPNGAVRQFVLLLSGLDGVTPTDRQRARAMAAAGAMVVAIDIARFQPRLEAEGGRCSYANGAFENLSRHLQAYERLPTYLSPMLVGRAVGGTLAYALLAQAAPETFASALSLGFCPELPFKLPLCEANALRVVPQAGGSGGVGAVGAVGGTGVTGHTLQPSTRLAAPWVVLPAAQEAACPSAQAFVERTPQARWLQPTTAEGDAGFRQAYAQLAERTVAAPPPPVSLADLPLVEVPATTSSPQFAVLLSGDGGWAGIDKELAAALAKRGVPVAGFDSLRYFWSARTPEGLAADLDRVIRYYAARWGRAEVVLIGYSQGADVLPFALNRLSPAVRARVRLSALLGPGQKASFEFHIANWVGKKGDRPVAPEAQRLSADDVLCVYGSEERDSLCPQLAPQHARVQKLTGGHHFDGDYDKLARLILEAAQRR